MSAILFPEKNRTDPETKRAAETEYQFLTGLWTGYSIA